MTTHRPARSGTLRRVRRTVVFLALAVSACGPDPLLVEPPWSEDAQVVLLIDGEVRAVVAGYAAAFAFDELEGHTVHALAYAPPSAQVPDLAACGVAPTDGADRIPLAERSWSITVRDEGAAFMVVTQPTDLRLVRCAFDPCPRTATESWALGDDNDEIRGLEVLPDGDTLVALGDGPDGGAILRWRDGGPIWRHELAEYVKGVAWDGAEKIYASEGQTLVALDLEGHTSTPARHLDEVRHVRGDGVGGVAVQRRNGIASVEGAWPDLEGPFHALFIAPGGTGLAADDRGVWRLVDGAWQLDLRDAAFGNVGGDATTLVALNEVADFIAYTDGRWASFEGPPEPGLIVARGRGDGRLVLAGNQGRLWFQEGDAWCRAETDTGQRLESLAVSVDGRMFVTGGAPSVEHPDETPVLSIVRVLD